MYKSVNQGVYKTNKTHVIIGETRVTKTFLPSRNYKRRFKRELKALSLMSEMDRVPKLIDSDNETFSLVMTRLAGEPPSTLTADNVKQLRGIVKGMLQSGVARHAIPIRDILVSESGQLGMVDFERISLRTWRFSPFWMIACIVSTYHMYRVIGDYQPDCLSKNEHLLLQGIHSIRSGLQPLNRLKKKVRRFLSFK